MRRQLTVGEYVDLAHRAGYQVLAPFPGVREPWPLRHIPCRRETVALTPAALRRLHETGAELSCADHAPRPRPQAPQRTHRPGAPAWAPPAPQPVLRWSQERREMKAVVWALRRAGYALESPWPGNQNCLCLLRCLVCDAVLKTTPVNARQRLVAPGRPEDCRHRLRTIVTPSLQARQRAAAAQQGAAVRRGGRK